jgi:hypothetical protein
MGQVRLRAAVLATLLVAGCAIAHVTTPAVDVWVLAPPKAHIEVPLGCAPTPGPTPAMVMVDSAISDSVWVQLAAIGAGFFALVSKIGWP